jgi:hypothetical protein
VPPAHPLVPATQADKNAGGDAHQVDADLKASLKKCDAGL